MTTFNPGAWNQANSVDCNNCYNYATDNKNTKQAGQPPPKSAMPGRTKNISPGTLVKIQPITKGGKIVGGNPIWKFTCPSVKIGCTLDGLKDPNALGNCDPNCWMVAYYVRAPGNRPPPPPGLMYTGDYHFVRQDLAGHAGGGGWSHKPGHGSHPVTDKQYNPHTGKYDGPKITNPATDNMGPLYQFCGYLCCCPGTRVASLEPPRQEEGGVAVAKADDLGTLYDQTWFVSHEDLADTVASMAELGGSWLEGFAEEAYSLRLDATTSEIEHEYSVLVAPHSLSVWDGRWRHLSDKTGTILTTFEDALTERVSAPSTASLAREVFQIHSAALATKCVELALAGDITALKIALEHAIPKRSS